jgi:hypothetical protein
VRTNRPAASKMVIDTLDGAASSKRTSVSGLNGLGEFWNKRV